MTGEEWQGGGGSRMNTKKKTRGGVLVAVVFFRVVTFHFYLKQKPFQEKCRWEEVENKDEEEIKVEVKMEWAKQKE